MFGERGFPAVGTWLNVFLGPYVAFPVKPRIADRLPAEEGGERLGWRSFYCFGLETEGRAYYMPRGPEGELPKPAPRQMYFGGSAAWPWSPDLIEVDTRAEVDWFVREYEAEIKEVAAALGSKPEFSWGLLSWYS